MTETWLPLTDAARAAHLTEKALRRRVERGTVESEVRDGRRLVLLSSIGPVSPVPAPGPRPADSPVPPAGADLSAVLVRLEQLAADVGRYRALTEVAESTEAALREELHRTRAELQQAREQLVSRPRRWWHRTPVSAE